MSGISLRSFAAELLILGDSLSAGYGLQPATSWVELLDQRMQKQGLSIQLVNASISGETTSGGLTRLPQLLARHQPKLVIIELGGNDGMQGMPLKLIARNLDALVRKTQQTGAKVMLLGMRIPPNYGRRYTDAFYQNFAQVAAQYRVAYTPFFLEGVGGVDMLMQADGIHPNAKAQPRLLDNVWPQLQPLLASIRP